MRRDFGITLLARCTVIACGIGTSILTARWLGPAGRGDYFAIVVLASLITQFSNFGLHASNTMLVARDPALSAGLAVNSIWISLLVGGSASVGLIGLAYFDLAPVAGGLAAAAASGALAPPMLFSLLAGGILLGDGRVAAYNWLQVFAAVGSLFCLGLILPAGGNAATAIFGTAVVWWLTALLCCRSMQLPKLRDWNFRWSIARAGLSFSGRTYLICLLGFLLLRANVILLTQYSNAEQLGFYSIAAQVFDTLIIIPASIGLVLFPQLVRNGDSDWGSLTRHLGRVALMMSVFTGCVAAAAYPLVTWTFGLPFAASLPTILLILPAALFQSLTVVVSQYFSAAGVPWRIIGVWGCGLLAATLFGLHFVPTYGAAGASAALAVSTGCVLVLHLIAARFQNALRPGSGLQPMALTPEPAAATIRPPIQPSSRPVWSSSSTPTRNCPPVSMNIVLSSYPLSAAFKARLEAVEPAVEYLHVSELRQHGAIGMLRKLRGIAPRKMILPLEDDASVVMLPVLRVLSACSRAKEIEVLDSSLVRRKVSRWSVLSAVFVVGWATCCGFLAMLRATRELRRLASAPRNAPTLRDSRCLYVKANLWYGLKAGGSVGHVAGVVNALCRRNHAVEYASVDGPVLLDRRVRAHTLPPPHGFGVPPEVNLYPAHQAFVKHLRPVVNSRSFGFIYQRLSLANYAGVSLSREQMLPLIIEYNGSEVWVQKNWGRALQFQKTAALAEEVCLKHAHLIVTISDVLRDELISRGVEPDRIVNYPNCIDPGMFNPADHTPAERAQLLSRHNLPHDTCLALFLGTFGQWHGVEVLAAAIRQMAIESPEWMRQQRLHFMLVGDGIKMHEVRQILSDPRCRPFYTLAGLVPQAEAPTYLAAADLLLSPHVPNSDGSKFFGSPTKLFEYMAMGKAILASDLDQIGDVLRHSLSTDALPTTPPLPDETRLAVLAAPGDASAIVHGVRFLAEQPAWREALGKNARREALGKYTWDHHVEAIFERFRGVVREADARPSNLLKAA